MFNDTRALPALDFGFGFQHAGHAHHATETRNTHNRVYWKLKALASDPVRLRAVRGHARQRFPHNLQPSQGAPGCTASSSRQQFSHKHKHPPGPPRRHTSAKRQASSHSMLPGPQPALLATGPWACM
eukprot:scaffold15590_cov136-Isochrysis_galbana.AAC.3